MKQLCAVFVALFIALPLAAQDDQVPKEPKPPQAMPSPSKPKAPKPPKKKKPLGKIRQKVKDLVPAQVQQGLQKSVAVATQTVQAPFQFLENTLFLVRTEFGEKLLLHLPSIDSDPNKGVTYGVMPVLLVPEKVNGAAGSRIKTIFAPSFTYNRIFGYTLTLRILNYYDAWQQVSAEAGLSEHTNREFVGEYSNERFLGDHYLELRAAGERDGSKRFFGVGPDSKAADQANYTRENVGYRVTFGQPVAARCKVGVQNRMERVSATGGGPLKGMPDLAAKYPGVALDEPLRLAWYRLYTSYDSRDSSNTPTRGQYVNLFWEVSPKTLLSQRDMTAWGGDVRAYFPHGNGFVFTPRLRWQNMTGSDIPFFALSRLGGKDTLRGYGEGRFIDKGMYTAGVEERWTGFKTDVMDTPIEFETGPFVEGGQVFPSAAAITARRTRTVAGFFLRGIARPQIVGSFDMGFGEEGPAIFLDVDYSW